ARYRSIISSFLFLLPRPPSSTSFPYTTLFRSADLIFCLDYSSLKRTECMSDVIAKASAEKWMIDHHLDPDDFADVQFWNNKAARSEEHTSELQSRFDLVCRLLLEKKKSLLITG